MKLNKAYTLKYRRRREGKTDYKARLSLLLSRKLRVVVRRKLNNIIVHVVEFNEKGDKTLVSGNSRELLDFGWKGHRGNAPSAYLTGLICGLKASKKGIKEGILDSGPNRIVKCSNIFAAVKGLRDGGLQLPCNEEYFSKEERLAGHHAKQGVKEQFNEVKNKIIQKWH